MRQAADHLTPVTLELGGKSPCIVDETAKILWRPNGLCLGSSSTVGRPVAPDYLLCHAGVKEELLACMGRKSAGSSGRSRCTTN